MGEGIRRSQAKAHVQELRETPAVAAEPNLFDGSSHSEALRVICEATPFKTMPSIGALVSLVNTGSAAIEVFFDLSRIGKVIGSGNALLKRTYFQGESLGKMVFAKVVDVEHELLSFTVEIA